MADQTATVEPEVDRLRDVLGDTPAPIDAFPTPKEVGGLSATGVAMAWLEEQFDASLISGRV